MNKVAVALAMGLWICPSAPMFSQDSLFVPAPVSPLTVGQGSGQVILADVNRDGHLDMLTQHLMQRSVGLLLGDGQGHFSPTAESPMVLAYQPGNIALGDVNNDQILDLGIASRDEKSEYVHVLLGNGRGRFKPASGSPVTISASMKTYKPFLRLIDVNEDGDLDIVTANGRRNTIEILIGDGRARFSPASIVKLEPGKNFYTFALGDVDGDGHVDLVTVSSDLDNASGRVATRHGDGTGIFKDLPDSSLPAPPDARLSTLADVNGDERLDIVLSHETNHVSVLLNKGDGMFAAGPSWTLDRGMEAFTVVVSDVNRDHNADLIAATVHSESAPYESRILVLLGDDRGFAPAPGSPFPAGPGAYRLTLGDVNEDGKLDIAASSFEGQAVTLLLGK